MSYNTADLYDQYEDLLKVALPIFSSYGDKTKFSGEIITIKCYEDNSLVAKKVGENGKGKVLIIDGGASLNCALVGGNLAKKAEENGWEGIIVYGCIRDSVEIAPMNIGIKAINTNPKKSVKRNLGIENLVVSFANVDFVPGEYVYSDEDGIVIS